VMVATQFRHHFTNSPVFDSELALSPGSNLLWWNRATWRYKECCLPSAVACP
jgi:hypothetical protein